MCVYKVQINKILKTRLKFCTMEPNKNLSKQTIPDLDVDINIEKAELEQDISEPKIIDQM